MEFRAEEPNHKSQLIIVGAFLSAKTVNSTPQKLLGMHDMSDDFLPATLKGA